MNLLLGCNQVVRTASGHIMQMHGPEPPDPRDWHVLASDTLTAAPTIGSESYDHRWAITDYRTQISSSCMGHSLRRTMMQYLALVLGETNVPSLSPLLPYTLARLLGEREIQRAPEEPRLIDWGCGPRWALKGCRDEGLCEEEHWPETPANINAVPDLASLKRAEGLRLASFRRISDGPSCSDEMRALGRRLRCPIVCMIVDRKFAEIGGGIYDGPGGDVLGGHAMTVVGYSSIKKAFVLHNSWGYEVGDGGFFWISEQVMNERTYDKWDIELVAA